MAGTRVQTWLENVAQNRGGVVKGDYAANTGDAREFDTFNMYEPTDYRTADTSNQWSDTTCKTVASRGGPQVSQYCQTGVMFYRSEIELSQISDGTANTYLVGEKYIRPEAYDGAATAALDPCCWSLGENQSLYTGFEWDNHRVAYNPLTTQPGAGREYFQPRQDTPGYENSGAFGSAHTAGLQMAMCDGSVQFISYDIDSDTHRWLAGRADGNVALLEEAQ
jgi:hypothetical protein